MPLSKNDILSAPDIQKCEVAVPEWGGTVFVKGMTGAERDKFESSLIEQRGKAQALNMANVRAKLCSLTICDETGKRLFGEADVQALSGKSAVALQRVFEIAQKLSGIGDADVKELTEGVQENPFGGSASD